MNLLLVLMLTAIDIILSPKEKKQFQEAIKKWQEEGRFPKYGGL